MTTKKTSEKIVVKVQDEKETEKTMNNKQLSPQTSPFEPLRDILCKKEKLSWTEFYEKQLEEKKKQTQNLTHNELTSMISKEWKKLKKQQRKNEVQKRQQINDLPICNSNISEDSQKIEQLKKMSLKLIFEGLVFELKGELILEALSRNCGLIYLNSQNKGSDSESIKIVNEEIQPMKNNIRNYL